MSTAPSNEVAITTDEQAKSPFLRRMRIRGYKSIAFCDVTLEPLTILVGRNASGKSNFIDSLAFLRDLLEVGVAEAVKRRGSWSLIHCRTSPEDVIGIDLELTCTGWVPDTASNGPSAWRLQVPLTAYYSVEIANQPQKQPQAVVEKLRIRSDEDGSEFVLDFDHGSFKFDQVGEPRWIPAKFRIHVT